MSLKVPEGRTVCNSTLNNFNELRRSDLNETLINIMVPAGPNIIKKAIIEYSCPSGAKQML